MNRREPGAGASRRSRVFTILSWTIALPLLGASMAWTLSSWSWIADLIANLAAQFLVVTIPAMFVWAVVRRRALALVALVACINHAALLSIGRAAYWPRAVSPLPPSSRYSTAGDEGVVRFFHYNASSRGRGDDVEQIMLSEGPDVITVVGPPISQQSKMIYGHHLSDRFAGKLTREWRPDSGGIATDITPCFIVARWPIEEWDTARYGPAGDHLLAGVVQRPRGPFAVLAVHPRSPRNRARWERGNLIVEAVAQAVLDLRRMGLEVVMLTDLNSTPTGYRSRRLYWAADLRRAKPLLAPTGTYLRFIPAGLDAEAPKLMRAFWPASIAIDDALVTSGIEVMGWSTERMLVSEHRPITVDLRIPFTGGGFRAPAGSVPTGARPGPADGRN